MINFLVKPLHTKVCKVILGVNKKATNNAVRGELGSFPLLIPLLCLSIKYWWKLNNNCMQNDNSLVVQALIDNRKLHVNYTTIFSWSSGIKSILQVTNRLDIWDKPNIIRPSKFNDIINSKLQLTYSNLWVNQINNFQSKLRSYCLFKKSFEMENYTLMCKRLSRSSFCKLRISAHSLMIEKGRHFSPKVNPEDRLCQMCSLNEVEDEFHFIMKCPLYKDLRSKLFFDIHEIYSHTGNLTDRELFLFIMSATDHDCILPVTQYVKAAFDIRSNIVL